MKDPKILNCFYNGNYDDCSQGECWKGCVGNIDRVTKSKEMQTLKVKEQINTWALENCQRELVKALSDNANPSEAIRKEITELKEYQAKKLAEKDAEIKQLKALLKEKDGI